MTLDEAKDYAQRMNDTQTVTAWVVRSLPAYLDPIQEGDNGWDVEMKVIEAARMYLSEDYLS